MPNRVLALILVVAATSAGAAPPDGDPPPAPVAAMTPAALASDPRMQAAIRHANLSADRRCGDGPGSTLDLPTRAAARACRKRMVDAARLDAEGEITGR